MTSDKKTVLIVEDSKALANMLSFLFMSRGIEVTTAMNGAKAMEQIKESAPDIIITDLMMPEMDGFELCKAVKKDAKLKHIPLIDVLVLASFYLLRVIAGTTLIEVRRFSPWLYVVTSLFALFIGLGKRRAELVLQYDNGGKVRPVLEGYTIEFLDQLIIIVSGTTIVSYSLYTFSAPNRPDNHSMMLTIPFVLYGIFRYLYLIQAGKGGAPEDIALSDRPLQAAILLWTMVVMLVFYFF